MNAVDSQAAAPLSREIALQAAEWFVLLHSGEASEADHRAFEAWRARADVHEQAWLRALAVSQRAGSLPPALGAPALGRKQRRLG
uniref:FecR/PupR family sigma factor regulator n=1 Tax=Delftia acidovorans TaxID=80866 RepID=UPI0035A1AAB6